LASQLVDWLTERWKGQRPILVVKRIRRAAYGRECVYGLGGLFFDGGVLST
jgi:hypothetical protein